jgi:hypothetical protein
MKVWLRQLGARSIDAIVDGIAAALQHVSPAEAENLLEDCGYRVP